MSEVTKVELGGSGASGTTTVNNEASITSSRPTSTTASVVESENLSTNQQLTAYIGKIGGKRKRASFDLKSTGHSKLLQQNNGRKKIGFIGAGNMARALAEGWLSAGAVKPLDLSATVRSASSPNLRSMMALGVNVTLSNCDVIGQCDIIIIAVKPYQVLGVMQEIHQAFKTSQTIGAHGPMILRPLIISVAASVPLEELEKKAEISWKIGDSLIAGHLPIIRCVPNIGCSVQSGVTVYTKGRFCNEEDIKPFVSLFASSGYCEEVEERYMDCFVGLTGSGLAFMEIALEAMADGGVMAGLPHPMALRMSAHTMIGAANLILKKKLHPAEVKNAVASPAGTTIAGILALETDGFRGAMMKAVKAAVDRATELKQS